MASLVNLTFHENNDETVDVVLTRVNPADDLTTVTLLEFVLKPSACEDDDDDDAVVLTSAPAGAITITTQSAAEIVAVVDVPGSALVETYERVWRLDALNGAVRRTALYGAVTVVDL